MPVVCAQKYYLTSVFVVRTVCGVCIHIKSRTLTRGDGHFVSRRWDAPIVMSHWRPYVRLRFATARRRAVLVRKHAHFGVWARRMPRNHTSHAQAPSVSRRCFRCWFIRRDVVKLAMGEWKAQISLRVRQAFRADLEQFAARERRTLGSIVELLLEWAFVQLQAAGTLTNLLKYQLGKRRDPPK